MSTFRHEIGISGGAAVAVVLSTTVMYVALVLILRTWGRRLLVSPSPRAVAVALVLGPLAGRTFLLLDPTLATGVLSLATLLSVAGLMRWFGLAGRRQVPPVPLVVAGEVWTDALTRHGLGERELWARLREAGHGSLQDLALVLLEPSGQLSVIAAGTPLDPRAVADVVDVARLPAHLFTPD